MVLNPNSFATLSAAETEVLEDAQEIIDAELRLKNEDLHIVIVRHAIINAVFNENERVLNALIASYEAVGWKVIAYDNEEQGKWLSFSED